MPDLREVVAGGPLSVRDEEHGQMRVANGLWHLRVAGDGLLDVVLTLPSERYVEAVLMGESAPGERRESLRALAVMARTFVLQQGVGRPVKGRLLSDVCDSTACQALKLVPVSSAVQEAVRSTAGETLWFGTRRAQVFFSEHCGGVTESAGALWPRLGALPYLQSKPDPYCVRSDQARWHAEVPVTSLQQIASAEGWHIPERVLSAAVQSRTASRRAQALVLTGPGAERAVIAAPTLRLAVGRALGWNLLRCDFYDVGLRNGMLVFDGRGHGHGVGLCQRGALEMAQIGKGYREILDFYLPGTVVRVTPQDSGWQRRALQGIDLRSTAPLTAASVQAAADARASAQQRFGPAQPVNPSVTFAPTTEIFRQLTGQPGWQAASTSGTIIVLQPLTVLKRSGLSLGMVLRHEMLHVAVEQAANRKAPIWLREGLVEVLDEEPGTAHPYLEPDQIEHLLTHSQTWQQSRDAHQAAGARLRMLVKRYGMPAVRMWLTSGSPAPSN